LFERLLDKHSQTCVHLTTQYRMNEQVMSLSNICMYNNLMKTANAEVANKRLKLDNTILYYFDI